MGLDDLALFVAVARELSFSAAARRLSLPVSRVSRRVADLEQVMGVRLLERTTRRVRLTEEGRALLDRCDAPIEALEGAVRRTMDAGAETRGVIRVTAPPLAARQGIGAKLISFAARNPEVSIELIATNAELDFIRDNIDLAFRLGPLDDSDLIVRRLWPVEYLLCAAPDFLDSRGLTAVLDRETLRGLPAISTRQPWRFEEVPRFGPHAVRHVLDDLEVAADAVRAGLGIAALPEGIVTPDLQVLSVAGLTPLARSMNVVYPSRRLLPKRLRDLIDHMIREA